MFCHRYQNSVAVHVVLVLVGVVVGVAVHVLLAVATVVHCQTHLFPKTKNCHHDLPHPPPPPAAGADPVADGGTDEAVRLLYYHLLYSPQYEVAADVAAVVAAADDVDIPVVDVDDTVVHHRSYRQRCQQTLDKVKYPKKTQNMTMK